MLYLLTYGLKCHICLLECYIHRLKILIGRGVKPLHIPPSRRPYLNTLLNVIKREMLLVSILVIGCYRVLFFILTEDSFARRR